MPNWKKVIVSGSDAHLNTLELTNTTTNDSILITSTDAGSSAAPVITLKRNSGSPADSDYLGQFKFKGENDADQEVIYSKITGKIQDQTDGEEDGIIEFSNMKGGTQTITARLKSDKLELINSTTLQVDGGIDVDNLNIDGTTIALSSGDLTLDSAGDIVFDADGTDIILKDDGTAFGRFKRDSSDFIIKSEANNNDIVFRGQDGGSTITAMTIDMSEGGNVILGANISGSATSTGSFGRVEVTENTISIGGTEISKTVADNIQNTSGTNTGDITLAGGSKDFISLSNQELTISQVDLTDDVTGVLPSANLDSDTAHLTTTQTFSGIKTFSAPITASAGVSGSASSTGSFGRMVVGSSGLAQSGSTLFEIQGQQGTLFNVADEMSGSIFSANTISGLSVIEAFSDQSVKLGPVSNRVTIDISGSLSASADIVTDGDVIAFNASDMRLKNNLKVIEGALDKIDGIAGYEFDWNDNSPGWARQRGHDVGVVAQEIEKIHPEIVEERKNGYLGVDYKRLVPLLIQSVKELKQEVEELKKKV